MGHGMEVTGTAGCFVTCAQMCAGFPLYECLGFSLVSQQITCRLCGFRCQRVSPCLWFLGMGKRVSTHTTGVLCSACSWGLRASRPSYLIPLQEGDWAFSRHGCLRTAIWPPESSPSKQGDSCLFFCDPALEVTSTMRGRLEWSPKSIWCGHVIPAIGKALRSEEPKFEASLGYIVRLFIK